MAAESWGWVGDNEPSLGTLRLALIYLVCSFIFNAIGATCIVPLYEKHIGIKNSLHMAFPLGVIAYVLFVFFGFLNHVISLAFLFLFD